MDAAKALSLWSAISLAALAVTVISMILVARYSRRVVEESELRVAQANSRSADSEARATAIVQGLQQLDAEVEQARARQREMEQLFQSELRRLEKGRVAPRATAAPIARRISDAQADAIVSAIRPFEGSEIIVSRVLGDAETGQYAAQFLTILRNAGWKAHSVLAPAMSPPPYGVTYQTDDPENVPTPVSVLLDAFKASGIDVSVGPGRGTLLVGLQPPAR